MTVVGTTGVQRTFLQAVARIIGEIGEQKPVTLMSPTLRIENAMSAVEGARDECFYKTMWAFRRAIMRVDLVASQMWYAVPTDYHKLASFFSRNDPNYKVAYVTYDRMLDLYPEMRLFPPGTGVADISTAIQAAGQTLSFGAPSMCTDWNGYVGLMPVPDAAFVALEGALYAHYWRHALALTSDNDDIDLPRQLWEAHHHLALSRLKKVLEYADWEADRLVGQRMLSEASSSKSEPEDAPGYNDGIPNYNE